MIQDENITQKHLLANEMISYSLGKSRLAAKIEVTHPSYIFGIYKTAGHDKAAEVQTNKAGKKWMLDPHGWIFLLNTVYSVHHMYLHIIHTR